MARIEIEEMLEDLSSDLRKALGAAVHEVLPDSEANSHQLFRAFKRAVRRKCNTWETVPDQHVQKE
jgi:hypothetical protein